MLSISKLSSSAQASSYYQKADYYTKGEVGEDVKSQWVGEGAKRLGLEGEVGHAEFKDLLDGKLPDGTQLGTVRNGKLEHTPGWDLTFSAPKSVSVLALVSGDKRLVEAHQQAVDTMTKLIEERYLVGRKNHGKDGVSQVKLSDLVGGTFTHSTSRDLDPQLHTHFVVMNMGRDRDGKDLSLHSKGLFKDKMFLGQIYRNELSTAIQKLGYQVEYDSKTGTFEIAGVDKSVLNEFSNRRKAIVEVADLFGYEGGKGLEKAALRSRERKRNVPRETVIADWETRLSDLGLTPDRLLSKAKELGAIPPNVPSNGKTLEIPTSDRDEGLNNADEISIPPSPIPNVPSGPVTPPSLKTDDLSVEHAKTDNGDPTPPHGPPIIPRAQENDRNYTQIAIEILSHYDSVFTYKDIVSKALKISKGTQNLAAIDDQMANLIEKKNLLRSEREPSLYTTHAGVRREHYMLDLLELGKNKHNAIATMDRIAKAASRYDFTDGQDRGFRKVLSGKDRVVGLQGYAGVGKTFMARPAIKLAQEVGYTVKGIAPYGTQVEQLESETGVDSNTLKSHLMSLENGKYQSQGNELWWVDEAGTVNSKDMADLLTHAHRLNARVVLSGDRKQLGAIEAGSPFSLLLDNGMDSAVNDNIIRQTNPDLKQAVYDIIDKKTVSAFNRLDKSIVESSSPASDAVKSYLDKEDGSFTNVSLIVPDIKTRNEMNRVISDYFRDRGDVKGDAISVSNLRASKIDGPMKRYSFFYEPGQVVRFHKSYKSLGVEKDEYLVVNAVNEDEIVLTKPNGSEVSWLPGKMAGGERTTTTYESSNEKYSEGDRIRWKDKTNELGLKNGHVGIIKLIDDKSMTVNFGSEIKVIDLQKNINRHFELAYAQTVYSVQGQTFQEAVLIAESWRVNLINQASFYVAVSRAKENISIFTDNSQKLREGIDERLGVKESAIPNISKAQSELIKDELAKEMRDGERTSAQQGITQNQQKARDRDRTMDY